MYLHHKHARGQASIEMVLTTAIIFLLAMAIVGYFINIKDSTVAMIVLKTEALGAVADEGKFYSIDTIEMDETDDSIGFNIITTPADLSPTRLASACDAIKCKTKYHAVSVSVNSTSACSVSVNSIPACSVP